VELAKQRHSIGAGRLVNAVLRRVERDRDSIEPPIPEDETQQLAQAYSHPTWLIARWLEQWSKEDVVALLAANNVEAPVVARPWRVESSELADMLSASGIESSPSTVAADSLVLQRGVSLLELGAFQQGAFFVQDPAATLVTQYADIADGSVVADLCAAPGGKTLELSRRASLVLASDVSRFRLGRMLEGFGRLDVNNIEATIADARMPSIEPVDVVLIDVPCTGTGTFRRHPDARWRLRISDISVLGALQRQIMTSAAKCVKQGGLLVYSPCSLEPEENDEQVDWFLAHNPAFTLESPRMGAVPSAALDNGRLRVLPQKFGCDGSFAVRFRRAS
jgi:16S rRNA (cytosine967-C5)-methyltransferase